MGCLAPQWIDRYKSDHREADSLRELFTYTARLGQTKALGLIWSVLLRGFGYNQSGAKEAPHAKKDHQSPESWTRITYILIYFSLNG